MFKSNQKAFTMIELIFVIVVIGILSAIAIPRFSATRDDAVITKAITTVASVRNAIATERQKRILRGDFNLIDDLASSDTDGDLIFDFFDTNVTRVLEYPIRSCGNNDERGCWDASSDTSYIYRMPNNDNDITFTLSGSRFSCNTAHATTGADCRMLTE
jgi:general secretion pathway protein G